MTMGYGRNEFTVSQFGSHAMHQINFPTPFRHDHPPVRNTNELLAEELSTGQRAADAVVRVMGSWPFVIVQSVLLVTWVILNIIGWVRHWDPYPFILMNLFLSLQAAYTAPMILMSANRQAQRDRIEAHHDYLINQKAEEEVRVILEHLDAQGEAVRLLYAELELLRSQLGQGQAR